MRYHRQQDTLWFIETGPWKCEKATTAFFMDRHPKKFVRTESQTILPTQFMDQNK